MACRKKKSQQKNFFESLGLNSSSSTAHGGEINRGKRKVRRPFDTKKPLHLVMGSSKARGSLNLLRVEHRLTLEKILRKQSKKFGVKIERYANVGNHLHFLLRCSNRKNFQAFLKSIAAMIARAVTKARRGRPFGKFWDALAYTRIVISKKALAIARKYIEANHIEAKEGTAKREEFLSHRSAWERRLYSS